MELTGFTTSPHHLEVTDLNKRRMAYRGLITVPVGRQHPGRIGFCLTGAVYSLDQKGVLASAAGIQAAVVGVASLTVTSDNPFVGSLLPVLTTLSSAGLEILVSNKGKLPPGDTTMVLLN